MNAAVDETWGPWLGIDPETKKRTHPAQVNWYAAGDYERAVTFTPGYRTSRTTYGKHGMEIWWRLRGQRGVTQFSISTGWVPGEKGLPPQLADLYPTGVDLGYHALVPQYDGHESFGRFEVCDFMPGKPCYYDGSGLNANALLRDFLIEGEPLVWRRLAEYHDELRVAS